MSSANRANQICAQTIQPLNNTVLVNSGSEVIPSNELYQFGMIVDLLIDVVRFGDELAAVVDGSVNQTPFQFSRLQGSVAGNKSRRFNEESTKPLAPFLTNSVKILRLTLEQADDAMYAAQLVNTDNAFPLKSYLLFLTDMFDIGHLQNFDEATFRLHLEHGQILISGLKLRPSTAKLAEALERELDQFSPAWQLRSGQSMELIWNQQRPRTPATVRQFDLSMQIEQLADRFDGLLWTANVPLFSLKELRKSIAGVARGAEVSVDDTKSDLEVGSRRIVSWLLTYPPTEHNQGSRRT